MTRSSLRKSFSALGFRKPHFLLANQFGRKSSTSCFVAEKSLRRNLVSWPPQKAESPDRVARKSRAGEIILFFGDTNKTLITQAHSRKTRKSSTRKVK